MDQGWTLTFWDPRNRGGFALRRGEDFRAASGVTGKSLVQRLLVERDPEFPAEELVAWNVPIFVAVYRISERGREQLAEARERKEWWK